MHRDVRDNTRRRIQSGVGFLVLGALAGQLVVAERAGACSCAEPEWRVELESVASSDASVDHRAFWPADAFLTPPRPQAQAPLPDLGVESYDDLGASAEIAVKPESGTLEVTGDAVLIVYQQDGVEHRVSYAVTEAL